MKINLALIVFGLLLGMLLTACAAAEPTPTPMPQRIPQQQPTITPGPPTERVRLRAIIYGQVQGVGFRPYVVWEAQSLTLVGYVCKHEEGMIECIAEGERQKAEKLLESLHVGPPDAVVEKVDFEWREATGYFNDFLEGEWCPPLEW